MEEKKVREDYLEFPWGIEDTIENLRELKSVLQRQVRETNCDGKGAQDAFEVGFDFDRAIEALEKQLPKKPTYEGDGYAPDGTFVYDTWECPNCGEYYEVDYDDYDYCPKCGQRIDWSEDRRVEE